MGHGLRGTSNPRAVIEGPKQAVGFCSVDQLLPKVRAHFTGHQPAAARSYLRISSVIPGSKDGVLSISGRST